MEKRNTIIAVLVSVLILVVWQRYMEKKHPLSSVSSTQTSQNSSVAPTQGASDIGAVHKITNDVVSVDQALKQTPRIHISTPSLSGSINLKGAFFDNLILNKYYDEPNKKGGNITLLAPKGTKYPYYVRYSWAGSKGLIVPDDQTLWTVEGVNKELTPDTPVTLVWNSPQNVVFKETYSIDKNYMISVAQEVDNNSGEKISVTPYGLVARVGTKKLFHYYLLHEGMIGYLNDGLQEVKYKKILEDGQKQYTSQGGWLGITDKYWLVSLVPNQNISNQASFRAKDIDGHALYQADYHTPSITVEPHASSITKGKFFAGAKVTHILSSYQKEDHIPDFKLAVDFGMFYFLTEPIFYTLHWLNDILGNFGLAIIALTILIKLIFFPLSYKSYVSMSRMKLLQPKIKAIKERYGSDRQKVSMETMALYKEEKVSPVAGCLPMLIQIPIFFALYKVLFVTIEMRHAPFYGWIHDLSSADTLGILTGFGLFHWNIPHFLLVLNIGLWPIFMGISMWLQQSLSVTTMDPAQAKMMKWLPVVFPFFMAHFPSGLVIYWTCNNLLTALQQLATTFFLEEKEKLGHKH